MLAIENRATRTAFLLSLGDPEVTLSEADLKPLAGTYRESRGGFEARVELGGEMQRVP